MKVLFLDIDGVLCLHRDESANWDEEDNFDENCCRRLKEIIEATGCKLVLSSFWRLNKTDIILMFKQLRPFGITKADFLGKTPLMRTRGEEIAAFLARRPEITAFAAIDDEAFFSDAFPPEHLILTELSSGITESVKRTVIETLLGTD